MQKTPSFLIGNDFISITIGSRPYTIYKGDARFTNVLNLIKQKAYDKLESALDTARAVAKYSDGNIAIYEDTVTYKGNVAHNAVATKILEFLKQDYPYQPLAKFLDKLMDNPSNNSVSFLYSWLERYKMPITEDGDFIGYKAVTSDFKDKHSQTVDNSLGKIIEMPRNQVDDDKGVNCSLGFHLGSFTDYVRDFANDTDNIIIVKVNPRDVVSLPIDASCSKMRVCRYEVIEVVGTKDKVVEFQTSYVGEKDELDEFGPVDLSKEATPLVLKGPIVLVSPVISVISGNKAYALHKEGKTLQRNGGSAGVETINPEDNKSRSFFRQYNNWALYNPTSNGVKIGANKAYELHKQGKTLSYDNNVINASDMKSRSFFRSKKNWTVI